MVDSQLVSLFNQGSFPSCRAMQRAESQLGALWKCKSSQHIYIFCAPFAQIPDVLNNVIRSSPKSKAVCEITSLAYGIERMPSEKKNTKKKEAKPQLPWGKQKQPLNLEKRKSLSVAVPLILGIKDEAGLGSSPREGWENCRTVQEMWLQRWIAKTQQKRISQKQANLGV